MELVEVLGCFTGQILKFSNWTQIPTNHLNLKNYCFTLTVSITCIIIVYRPPISVKNGLTHAAFFYEFSMLLERLVSSPANLLLNVDSNFHVNAPSDSTSSQFLDLLNCFNLNICNLCTPTHKNNNVLDLIITTSGETSVSNLSVHGPVISDHSAVHCSLAIITSRRMPGHH